MRHTYRNIIAPALCCWLLLAVTACSNHPATRTATERTQTQAPAASPVLPGTGASTPPADVVRASTSGVRIIANGSAETVVRLTVADGYHINANPPSFSYLKATELEVEPGGGITAGKPFYPPSLVKKFEFSEQPLAVYEGETIIRLPLRAAKTAAKEAHTLRAKVRVQACDQQACYPPRTIETTIPVTVE